MGLNISPNSGTTTTEHNLSSDISTSYNRVDRQVYQLTSRWRYLSIELSIDTAVTGRNVQVLVSFVFFFHGFRHLVLLARQLKIVKGLQKVEITGIHLNMETRAAVNTEDNESNDLPPSYSTLSRNYARSDRQIYIPLVAGGPPYLPPLVRGQEIQSVGIVKKKHIVSKGNFVL